MVFFSTGLANPLGKAKEDMGWILPKHNPAERGQVLLTNLPDHILKNAEGLAKQKRREVGNDCLKATRQNKPHCMSGVVCVHV